MNCAPVLSRALSLSLPLFYAGVWCSQFVYCMLVGSFPFNSFLAGFSSTVGAFVLTGKLSPRMQAAGTLSRSQKPRDFSIGYPQQTTN